MQQLIEELKSDGGWVVAGILIAIATIKYGATWIRALRETGNTANATLIAGLQARIDTLDYQLAERDAKVKELREECDRLRERIIKLERADD